MTDDDHRDMESGDTGATGRAPRPQPSSDREFDELDSSFTDPPSSKPAFFEEVEFDDDPTPPPSSQPVDDFGFDEIAQGDEPVPGSRRSSRRGGIGATASSAKGRVASGGRSAFQGLRSRVGGRGGSGRGRSGGGGRGGGRPRGGSGGRARRPGGSGNSPLSNPAARAGIIALVALLIVTVVVLWVRDVRRTNLENSYKSYINEASQVSEASAAQGTKLIRVLQNPDGKAPAALKTEVETLANEARTLQERGEALKPPDGLVTADSALQMSLRMRTNSLTAMAQLVPDVVRNNNEQNASRALAGPMKRLLASDVIYDEEYARVAAAQVREEGIDQLEVPTGVAFLTGTTDRFASDAGARILLRSMKSRQGKQGGDNAQDGALRGTSVEGVIALPASQTLGSDLNTLAAAADMEWQVEVKNGGEFPEQGIDVTAELYYDGDEPVDTQKATIEEVTPGQTLQVKVPGPPATAWDPSKDGRLVITAAPVPGETNVDNNTRTFQVKFTSG